MFAFLGVLFHLIIIDFYSIILIVFEKIKAEISKVVFRTVIAMQLQGDITEDDI